MCRRAWLALIVGVGCAGALVHAWTVSLSPRDWSKSGSAILQTSADGGLSITLPTWPNALGYLWTSPHGPLDGSLLVSFRIETTGAPVVRWDLVGNTCQTPATVRPFFGRYSQRRRKIEYADRWWPVSSFAVLGPGVWSLLVPIDRTFYTGVQFTGLSNDAAFALAASDPDLIGLSFGGGCFYGHGVGIEGGTMRLVLTEVRVQ